MTVEEKIAEVYARASAELDRLEREILARAQKVTSVTHRKEVLAEANHQLQEVVDRAKAEIEQLVAQAKGRIPS